MLAAAVRPEFAVAVYLASPDDSVLGRPLCRVPGCREVQRSQLGLCRLHCRRWHDAGEPDVESFAVGEADAPRRGRIDKCLVPACRRARRVRRFCTCHLSRWRQAGLPDAVQWAADQTAAATGVGICAVPDCEFPLTTGPSALCDYHALSFTNSDFDSEASFATAAKSARGRVRYDLTALEDLARLEMQFLLQQRHDEGGAALSRGQFNRLVNVIAATGGSLLDRSEAEWETLVGATTSTRFLRFALDRLQLLRDGAVMDWDADSWDLRRALGVRWDVYKGRRINFAPIAQPWLRRLAKRWARVRLASRAQNVVVADVRAIAKFSGFLAERGLATTANGLRRDHLEQFLAWLPSTGYGQNTLAGLVSSVRTFLDDCAAHGWNTGMAGNARLFPGEGPRFVTGLPRFIGEDVMAQLEDVANVARWSDPHARNLFLILRETGKRAGEVVTLERKPVLLDSTGAPCLLYRDHKGRRDAIVPISDIAAEAIVDQQRIVAAEWPASPWLFPRPGSNTDGSRHFTTDLFNRKLNKWLRDCHIRDASGDPVTVSSHQFRHTLATRMLNLGVPQHIVQQMLGHVGADTVSTYARLSDTTMRAEFERYQHERINVHGEVVTYRDTSPTAEAEWLKHRISKALETLPNGECGRPIQQVCPHPNACLTCDDFLTDRRHLEAHRDQLDRTRTLIATADTSGNFRMAEMNRQVEINLTRIIDTIHSRDAQASADAAR